MMSLSVGYPQILASGYPDSKFAIRFSPSKDVIQLLAVTGEVFSVPLVFPVRINVQCKHHCFGM